MAEQEEFLDTLCEIVDQEQVDLVLVAGDVFDSANPGAQVERLYYHSLERLAGNGKRVVVVIGGNHDSPDRIQAADPLAVRQDVYKRQGLRIFEQGKANLTRNHQGFKARAGYSQKTIHYLRIESRCKHNWVLEIVRN